MVVLSTGRLLHRINSVQCPSQPANNSPPSSLNPPTDTHWPINTVAGKRDNRLANLKITSNTCSMRPAVTRRCPIPPIGLSNVVTNVSDLPPAASARIADYSHSSESTSPWISQLNLPQYDDFLRDKQQHAAPVRKDGQLSARPACHSPFGDNNININSSWFKLRSDNATNRPKPHPQSPNTFQNGRLIPSPLLSDRHQRHAAGVMRQHVVPAQQPSVQKMHWTHNQQHRGNTGDVDSNEYAQAHVATVTSSPLAKNTTLLGTLKSSAQGSKNQPKMSLTHRISSLRNANLSNEKARTGSNEPFNRLLTGSLTRRHHTPPIHQLLNDAVESTDVTTTLSAAETGLGEPLSNVSVPMSYDQRDLRCFDKSQMLASGNVCSTQGKRSRNFSVTSVSLADHVTHNGSPNGELNSACGPRMVKPWPLPNKRSHSVTTAGMRDFLSQAIQPLPTSESKSRLANNLLNLVTQTTSGASSGSNDGSVKFSNSTDWGTPLEGRLSNAEPQVKNKSRLARRPRSPALQSSDSSEPPPDLIRPANHTSVTPWPQPLAASSVGASYRSGALASLVRHQSLSFPRCEGLPVSLACLSRRVNSTKALDGSLAGALTGRVIAASSPNKPTKLEFSIALMLNEGLTVDLLRSVGSSQAFNAGLRRMVDERERDFVQGFNSDWSEASLELFRASKLFSQSTIHQKCDTQKTNWFIEETEIGEDWQENGEFSRFDNIQSQLMSHVDSTSNQKSILAGFKAVGVGGLERGLELPRYSEKRRIQNSVRRFSEFLIETYIYDLAPKDGLSSLARCDDEVKARIIQWILRHPARQVPILRRIWETIQNSSHTSTNSHADCQPFSLGPQSEPSSASLDSCTYKKTATAEDCWCGLDDGENRRILFGDCWRTLSRIDLIPPELNTEDVKEILQVVQLASAKRQLESLQDKADTEYIDETDFLSLLATVPANLPDFPLDENHILGQIQQADDPAVKSKYINNLLRMIKRTANRISGLILNKGRQTILASERPDERALARLKISTFSGMWTSEQAELLIRHPIFTRQDFLCSWIMSIEELQLGLALHENEQFERSLFGHANSEHQCSSVKDIRHVVDEALSKLDANTDVITQECADDADTDGLLVPARVVQLALEYLLGAAFLLLKPSEKYCARDPLGPLAIGIRADDIPARFYTGDQESFIPKPAVLPLIHPTALPLGTVEKSCSAPQVYEPSNSPARVIEVRGMDETIEIERRRRLLSADVMTKLRRPSLSLNGQNSNQPAATAGSDMEQENLQHPGERLHIDADLLGVFALIHAPETLSEVLRLSQAGRMGGDSATSGAATPQKQQLLTDLESLTKLTDARLRGGSKCADKGQSIWDSFWCQGSEEWSLVNASGQNGSWGPLQWPSLRQVCVVYDRLVTSGLLT